MSETGTGIELGPFRTWNGRELWRIHEGVRLHAVGGEQVLLCRVVYEPGTTVDWHSHEHTEQVMLVLEGEIEVTIEAEARILGPGDVVVINRGLRHTLHARNGVTFVEALSPLPLDHVPDRELDLVLGPDRGAAHVER
jgi:quercetin dioxygenase-like cupin family protein